jgi:hypothetical protein
VLLGRLLQGSARDGSRARLPRAPSAPATRSCRRPRCRRRHGSAHRVRRVLLGVVDVTYCSAPRPSTKSRLREDPVPPRVGGAERGGRRGPHHFQDSKQLCLHLGRARVKKVVGRDAAVLGFVIDDAPGDAGRLTKPAASSLRF